MLNIFPLTQWRYTVAEFYADVRRTANQDPIQTWQKFRTRRDNLFRYHVQTPLNEAQLERFSSLPYYNYDPTYRVLGQINEDVARETFSVDLGGDGLFRYTRVGKVEFALHEHAASLFLYWIEGYGGGLFVPFQDETSGQTTYGGGRYLYDTIKGADLGTPYTTNEPFMLDFNYAYNPSCAYNGQWVCPLSPAENRLPFPVTAGERLLEA